MPAYAAGKNLWGVSYIQCRHFQMLLILPKNTTLYKCITPAREPHLTVDVVKCIFFAISILQYSGLLHVEYVFWFFVIYTSPGDLNRAPFFSLVPLDQLKV